MSGSILRDGYKAAIDACRNLVLDVKNTSLKIISAVEYPTPIAAEPIAISAEYYAEPFAISAEYYNEIEQAGRKQAEEFIRQAERQIHELFPNSVPDLTTEIIIGSPPRVIVETATEWGADLIVVGSHGYGFWSRTLLGSVSNSVVHHAPCSVLVVRAVQNSDKSAS